MERKKKSEYVLTDGELTEKLLTLGLDDFEVKDKSGAVMEKDRAKAFLVLLAEIEATEKMVAERGFDAADLVHDENAQGSGASMLKKQFSALAGYGYQPDDWFAGALRKLLDDVRAHGKQGLSVYRFKGLGEMDAEELFDTTMNPAKRRMLRVKLNDAAADGRRGRAAPPVHRRQRAQRAQSRFLVEGWLRDVAETRRLGRRRLSHCPLAGTWRHGPRLRGGLRRSVFCSKGLFRQSW